MSASTVCTRAFLLAGIMLAAGCMLATPYAPASYAGGYGYWEQLIEDNRYRIVFRGNTQTPRETVENFLLYRAAELTAGGGYDYFTVVEGGTEDRLADFTVYVIPGVFPGHMRRYGGAFPPPRFRGAFPYHIYGYPHDMNPDPFNDTDIVYVKDPDRDYRVLVHITMHRGEKPDDPHSFSAGQVLGNLSGFIMQHTPGTK